MTPVFVVVPHIFPSILPFDVLNIVPYYGACTIDEKHQSTFQVFQICKVSKKNLKSSSKHSHTLELYAHILDKITVEQQHILRLWDYLPHPLSYIHRSLSALCRQEAPNKRHRRGSKLWRQSIMTLWQLSLTSALNFEFTSLHSSWVMTNFNGLAVWVVV